MAGLLLGLRRQIAKNRRKDTYGTPHMEHPTARVYTLEQPVKQDAGKVTDKEEPQDRNIRERTVDAVSKEDFLLNQIDEFRERAKQLQTLLNTRESEAQELQTLVDERQEKAEELNQILKERQEKADGITAEVEKQIYSLIAKVSAKMDEIESSMKEDVEDGKRFNEEKAKELKASLEQIEEQLTTIKSELSEKVHTENVKCYRNISELFKSMEEKLERITVVEDKLVPIKGFVVTALVFGILNFIAMVVLIFVNLGIIVL